MKKTCAFAALMAASILIANSAAPADGKNRKVTLFNNSSDTIKELYASPITAKTWEENLLANRTLEAGQSISANIDNGTAECHYDLKIVLASGRSIDHHDVDICAVTKWAVTDSGDSFEDASSASAKPSAPAPNHPAPIPAAARTAPAASHAALARLKMVRAQDPQSLVADLQANGYAAELGVDKVGDPMITSSVAGTKFQIFFYNCTNHAQCATVTFHSGYDMPDNSTPLDLMNDWNRSKRFGRAYLDKETDPILEMDVDLDDGGEAPLLFIDNIEFWAGILSDFEKRIGYRK